MALPTANLLEWFGGGLIGYHRRMALQEVNSPTYGTGIIGDGYQPALDAGGRRWIIDNADAVGTLAIGTGSYSVSFWINPTAADSGHRGAVSFGGNGSTDSDGLDIRIHSNGTQILAYLTKGTTTVLYGRAGVLTVGVFAACFAGC